MLGSEIRRPPRAATVPGRGMVRRSPWQRMGSVVWFAMALWVPCVVVGCSNTPTLEPLEGVTLGQDGLFRGMDLEGVSEQDAFLRLLQRVKSHFGSGSVFHDADLRTVEVERPFDGRAARVRFMAQVAAVEGGSRIELFTRIEELREDISEDPQNPWIASDPDRDLLLENFFFNALREDLVVAPEARRRLNALENSAPENHASDNPASDNPAPDSHVPARPSGGA